MLTLCEKRHCGLGLICSDNFASSFLPFIFLVYEGNDDESIIDDYTHKYVCILIHMAKMQCQGRLPIVGLQ